MLHNRHFLALAPAPTASRDWAAKKPPSFPAKLGGCLSCPQCLRMAGERTLVAVDITVLVDKVQPPAIALFKDSNVAGCTMSFDGLAAGQCGDAGAAVSDQWGYHGNVSHAK